MSWSSQSRASAIEVAMDHQSSARRLGWKVPGVGEAVSEVSVRTSANAMRVVLCTCSFLFKVVVDLVWKGSGNV